MTHDKNDALVSLIDCINRETFNINAEPSFSITLDDSCHINDALLSQIFYGYNDIDKVDIEYYIEKVVPIRHHKKRRIQKKWIKKYGYKIIRDKHTIKDMTLEQINKNNFVVKKEV